MEKRKFRITSQILALLGMLTALQMVLQYLIAINTPIMRIGFGFVPMAIAAILYGPWGALTVGVIADVLGSTLFSTGWYPPLTITATCYAITFGVLLYNKYNPGFVRIIIAALIYNFIFSMLLQTYLLTFLTGKGFMLLLSTRSVQACIMFAIQMVILPILVKTSNMLDKQFHLYGAPSKA